MRLPKAKSAILPIALSFLLFALIFVQCIFVTQGRAYAQEAPYSELITDYFSFNAPTRIAAGDGMVAVFDKGNIVLFGGEGRKVFSAGVTKCNELCVSEKGIFLLAGVSEEEESETVIKCFDLTGAERTLSFPTESVTDIALSGNTLFTLSPLLGLKAYSLTDGSELDAFVPGKQYLGYMDVCGEDMVFLSWLKGIFRKQGDSVVSINNGEEEIGSDFAVCGEDLFYVKEGNICRYGKGVFLQKDGAQTADATFSYATDFAVANGRVYVLDAAASAVKIYLEDKTFEKMIGSYGKEMGRLYYPTSLSVKGDLIAVADGRRVSVFSKEAPRALLGRSISDPTNVVFAGNKVYLADDGGLYEYGADLSLVQDYSFAEGCRFVAAGSDGRVFAASGKNVYRKGANEEYFSPFITADKTVDGLNVGMGGKILYLLAGTTLTAYSQEGERIGSLERPERVKSFAVDYCGNVFFLAGKKVLRYARTPEGYSSPETFDLPAEYDEFTDLVLDGEGRVYLLADHNVIVYQKAAFNVCVDSDFTDEVPNAFPLFVCEVTAERTIAYAAPDNFEDIVVISKGQKLLCYASVWNAGDEYLRVETEKGTRYIPKGDAMIFSEGEAPFAKARCVLSGVGSNLVGVDLYAEPSKLAVQKGRDPLYKALGEDAILTVESVVAVDESGRDVWGFYRVSYQGVNAYVLKEDVMSADDEPDPMPPVYRAKVSSSALGKTVPIYKEPSRSGEVVARLTDGSKIYLLEKCDKNKEFIMVLYGEEVCYVLSENIKEGGLSGGQILAIVLTVVAAVGSVLTILIMRANKKHKRYRKE